MSRNHELLLSVWREACRHIEITESTVAVAELLAEHLPLRNLVIRRFDPANHSVETVASCPLAASEWPTSQVPTAMWKRLTAWAKRGRATACSAASRPSELASIMPVNLEGEMIVGPLVGSDDHFGAIIAVADQGKHFRHVDELLLQDLLEPFSVALENDRRLRELSALRAAAEAEKRSLLTRLGRQEGDDPIVGSDSGLRHVMQRVELVTKSDVPVLILGETGTGKEVVSRSIHNRSPQATGPFIRVNCGAIPPELIDSQLFGHEKGSFTGAADTRQGWFERADGGTLFLDEIGELPLPAQVRLLRVLQDGCIERVGGTQTVRVHVRIIAATHRDLASMVKAGTFREDLWYRINVFPILLPRLSERKEDIPALARHFAHRAATRFGLPVVEPTRTDLDLLMNYPWPGNIRELGAVIDRATILGGGNKLDVATALGAAPVARPPALPAANTPTFYEVIPEVTQPLIAAERIDSTEVVSLDAAMKRHIERALVVTRGRIEGRHGVAALLKINPHTLRARMKKLGIDWEKYRPTFHL
jgi:transcriptional regulator with GAF, ATPase, and Fis domain